MSVQFSLSNHLVTAYQRMPGYLASWYFPKDSDGHMYQMERKTNSYRLRLRSNCHVHGQLRVSRVTQDWRPRPLSGQAYVQLGQSHCIFCMGSALQLESTCNPSVGSRPQGPYVLDSSSSLSSIRYPTAVGIESSPIIFGCVLAVIT